MRSTGTKKTTAGRKRRAHAKTTRLSLIARRFGPAAICSAALLWLGAWLWLSGTASSVLHQTSQNVYNISAEHGFAVENIFVQGREYTDPELLRILLGLERGDPILAFDPKEAQKLVERISWVKSAQVVRHFPDSIFINLIEREPLALWQNKGTVRLIDAEGVTLPSPNIERFSDLILLVGIDAPEHAAELTALLSAEPVIKERVDAAIRVGDRRWDLRFKNGMEINLPEEGVARALRRLAQAHEQDGLLDKDLMAIDARDAMRLVARPRPGAVRDHKASLRNDI